MTRVHTLLRLAVRSSPANTIQRRSTGADSMIPISPQKIYSINLDFTVNPFMEPLLTSMSTSRIARCTWVVNKSCRLEDDDCFLLLQKISSFLSVRFICSNLAGFENLVLQLHLQTLVVKELSLTRKGERKLSLVERFENS